jgi:hypothetical protein
MSSALIFGAVPDAQLQDVMGDHATMAVANVTAKRHTSPLWFWETMEYVCRKGEVLARQARQ